MDFELDADQTAIIEAVEALLAIHAGPPRAIELNAKSEYDGELDHLLRDSGFMEVARDDDTGPLEAALVVEAAARAAGVVAVGASALIVPGLTEREIEGPVAIAEANRTGPVRYAAHARSLLLLADDEVRLLALAPGDCPLVQSNFGYPMGRLSAALAASGESLGAGSGARLRDWWRVALAVEAAGTMRAALDYTVEYLKQRKQFGHAIGSFQGVQHRLANCAIAVEGARWMAYEAAHHGAPQESAAAAAAFAMDAAGKVFADTHQLSGAIGFTREHDLHVWSMRLQALRAELGGVAGHRRALAQTRWGRRG